ncbi:YqaJ-like viral recombinase domain protein [Andreesenia angusta]|uniref:YqaJ-like viral recombinase domain protein n=1 Tax=Andreesenia angusta TaxID=39480 RepID=A0A1S1V6N5_9FIRM|nr:YqaJ viral recombinase family protein [Andreesenia angusta]OHW62192.1 YqaJ-like viral recombinase domain protein [Andreesenia angusta]
MIAKVLVNTPDLSYEEWLKYRTKGIGGSDCAAIAGMNPWKSPISTYRDKIGEGEPIPDNERMRIGRDLEDYVATRFEEATGLKTRRRNAILYHPEHEFMLANVDRLVVGTDEGLECKTTGSYSKKEWEEGIPQHYELQCHHYMAVTGYKAWWIACLIGNEQFVCKKIDRDEDIIDYLTTIEKNFWENHVLKREMPAPDGSDDSGEIIKMMYPRAVPESSIDLEESFIKSLERRDEIAGLIKKLEVEKKEIEQKIQLEMGENEKATVGERLITWKSVESSRIDSKRFKKDHPDLYAQYTNKNEYRRFKVK